MLLTERFSDHEIYQYQKPHGSRFRQGHCTGHLHGGGADGRHEHARRRHDLRSDHIRTESLRYVIGGTDEAMWTRKELKQNAWNSLKPHYWAALGASLLAYLLGASQAYGKMDFSEIPSAYENLVTMYMQEGGVESEAYAAALVTLGIILLIAVPIGLVLYAFAECCT